jgi:hypothetical protein
MDKGEKLVNIRYKGRRTKTKKHKNIAQHIKLKRWAARTLQNTEDESRCSRRVSSSLYDTHISSNRRVPFFFFFSFFLLFFLFFFFFLYDLFQLCFIIIFFYYYFIIQYCCFVCLGCDISDISTVLPLISILHFSYLVKFYKFFIE